MSQPNRTVAATYYPGHTVKLREADSALVCTIQDALSAQGYGPFMTGHFDPAMQSIVRLFQSQHVDYAGRPLDADGIVGRLTWGAIFGVPPDQPELASSAFLTKVVAIAKAEVGVREEPPGSNRGPRVDDYLKSVGIGPKDGTAQERYWCMAFAYFCVNEAAKALSRNNPLAVTAGVMEQWELCSHRNGVYRIAAGEAVADPALVRPGQLLILDHGHGLGHTGVIIDRDGPHLTLVEGNSSGQANDRNGVGVFETRFRKLQDAQIKGYIDYDW